LGSLTHKPKKQKRGLVVSSLPALRRLELWAVRSNPARVWGGSVLKKEKQTKSKQKKLFLDARRSSLPHFRTL
jgi:hypothetical protein